MLDDKWKRRLRKTGRVLLYALAVLYLLALYDRISDVQSDVSSMESEMSSIEADVSSIQNDVGSIQSDVDSIESNQAAFHHGLRRRHSILASSN